MYRFNNEVPAIVELILIYKGAFELVLQRLFYFMKQFVFPPELKRGETCCAVYKMIFDCGSYYIGSSINIKQRMWGWKFKLENGIDKNYRVTEAFKQSNTVRFEIIEVIEDPVIRCLREEGYIKINFGKPLCLNISSSAFTNENVKHNNPNKKKRLPNVSQYKPVAQVDGIGQIIETYINVTEAMKKHGKKITDCFSDSSRKVKGMIFRRLDNEGNVIPAPFIAKVKKERKSRFGYKISNAAKKRILERNAIKRQSPDYTPPKQAKKIIQMNIDGTVVATHLSIQAAARLYNVDARNFKRQINKSPRNYYKGYIWKYA